jgi:hypothetical protein
LQTEVPPNKLLDLVRKVGMAFIACFVAMLWWLFSFRAIPEFESVV